ncbi:MAG: GTP-binding protein, partial [Promethearchaeota archaeon]
MSAYDYTFKVLLLGDASAEKSALTKRYCYNIFNPSEKLTIGVDFHVKLVEFQNKRIKLQIWDVGGEERFRFLLPSYCLGANAAFLLYDITRPKSLDNIREWVNILRQKGGKIPIMLIGTKLELREEKHRVSREYGIKVAKKNKLNGFAEVSAKTGQNVNKVFEVLTELALDCTEGKDFNQFIITDGTHYEDA